MQVTRDKYELPVAVADTETELARKVGVKRSSIHGAIANAKRRNQSRCIYVRVPVEEVED